MSNEQRYSRSSRSKHFCSSRSRSQAQRQAEEEREDQDHDDLDCPAVLFSKEYHHRCEEKSDCKECHDQADEDVDASFVVEEEIFVCAGCALLGVGEKELFAMSDMSVESV